MSTDAAGQARVEEFAHVQHPDEQHHEVVIVGAGFAGLEVAKRLGRAGIDVLLIDQNLYHQFQPLLYQVATSQVAVASVASPLRSLLHKLRRHVTLRTATVSQIDAGSRTVTTSDGLRYHAQILVVAAGAVVNFFDTPGAEEHAYPLYSVDDATALSSAMLGALDRAATGQSAVGEGTFSVAVVGSGPTGVETAGAIAENIKYVVSRYYSPEFAARSCRVHLVDMVDTVLGPFSQASQHYAADRLRSVGVQLRLGSAVSSVDAEGVTLADGSRIRADIVIWAGGLKANSLLSGSGLDTGRGGRVDVAADLTAPDVTGVYVLGDAANIVDAKGRQLPQLGSVAQQSGKHAARNIMADLRGEPRTPFTYLDKGIMAMVGRGAAVAELGAGRLRVLGPAAFLAWLAVHAALLPGVSQRVTAVTNWCRDYLSHRRPQVVVHQPAAYDHTRAGKTPSTASRQ